MTRTFETGANRNSSDGKYAYKDFVNPLCEYSLAKYMHGKRLLDDGTLRDGDNWQRGIDQDSLVDSFKRHAWEFEMLHLGFVLLQYKDDTGEHTEVFMDGQKNELTIFIETLEDKDIKWWFVELEDVLNALRFNSEAYKLQLLGYKKVD